MEENAAGIRIVETTRPWSVDERAPRLVANCGMAVMGPIVPVSSLVSA